MTNSEKVMAFIGKWEARDIEGIMATFAPSPFYHNVPMQPLTTPDSIREFIEGFMGAVTAVKWDVLTIAETEQGIVMTERVDRFEFGEKAIALPLMGTFEFDGDKLVRWLDYFDLGDFERQMAALQE
ncbi:MAG: limonene-1,2-epoxide hydrolase family protein [Pseudomonadota bacterium]